jgi:diamine N-acetyltransferase
MATSASINLQEITEDNLVPVLKLAVHKDQERFVSVNSVSVAQAHFHPTAWFRAIYAGDKPVGFVMLDIDPLKEVYYLWRFMIDVRHQGKGYGAQAISLIIDHIRKNYPAAKAITLSYVPADGSAEPFYRKFGFLPTGEMDEDEAVMKLDLESLK